MKNSVFFRKIRTSANGNTVSIICSDKPVSAKTTELMGFQVSSQDQTPIQFGVLSLRDPQTGKVLTKDHPTIKGLQNKLSVGDEMPGFRMSSNSIKDEDGEDTCLVWVESC